MPIKLAITCVLITLAALFLSGCDSFTSIFPANDYCLKYHPIPNSLQNIEPSRLGIDEQNAIWVDECADNA